MGRWPLYDTRFCSRRNVRDRRLPSTVTDTNAGSVRSDQPPLLSDVPGHPTAGAVGRSESTLAFTTCTIRRIGNLWDDSQQPTPLSAAGGTSGIVPFDQRFPIRTLGAFVPSNSPFFQIVPGHENLLFTSTHTDISGPRTVRAHPSAGAFCRSESALAFTTGPSDRSGTCGTTSSSRPLYLPLAERPESPRSINGHRHERWERSFRPTAPAFARCGVDRLVRATSSWASPVRNRVLPRFILASPQGCPLLKIPPASRWLQYIRTGPRTRWRTGSSTGAVFPVAVRPGGVCGRCSSWR